MLWVRGLMLAFGQMHNQAIERGRDLNLTAKA
jgi:hypothetical protein